MDLSVVFSFRNEEEVLFKLIDRIKKTLNPMELEYELIFVNDDSNDNSLKILKEIHEKDKRIKVINMSRRFGVAPCVMAGFKHSSGKAVVYMDTDLQDPPELIPELYAEFKNGADVVNTTRKKRYGENFIKMWITRKAYQFINMVSEISIPQETGDFKLLSRAVVDELILLNEHDPFTRGLVRWVGFKQVSIFYERDPRFAGTTKFPLLGSKGPIMTFISGCTSFSSFPLNIFLYFGILLCLLTFLLSAGLVTYSFFQSNVNNHILWLVLVNTFLLSIMFISNGIVGLYLGRVYNEVKKRPNYIIKSKIGF